MYGKLFESAFTGSMMGAGADVFAVWAYVIANAKKGSVELNPKHLAALIGAEVGRMEAAIEFLCGPDPYSRSQAEEGRRLIKEGQFLYEVVNHELYRQIISAEDKKEADRRRMAEKREKEKDNKINPPNAENATNRGRSSGVAEVAHTEAEADTEADTKKNDSSYEESTGVDVDNPASEKNPDLDEFVKLAKEVTEARIKKGFGNRLTFQIGQIIRGGEKTWVYGVEFLKVVQKGYMDCKDETIWRLWNSPPDSIMAQNTWEKTNIMKHEKLKKEIEERG